MNNTFPKSELEIGSEPDSAQQYFQNLSDYYRYAQLHDDPTIVAFDSDEEDANQYKQLLDKFMTSYFGENYHADLSRKAVGLFEADTSSDGTTVVGKLLGLDQLYENGASVYTRNPHEVGTFFICQLNKQDQIINMTVAYNDNQGPIAGKTHVAYSWQKNIGEFKRLES